MDPSTFSDSIPQPPLDEASEALEALEDARRLLAESQQLLSEKNAELDEFGQYKVQLPFDLTDKEPNKASARVRMATPYAGSNHGMHFPLHKNAEVLLSLRSVDFVVVFDEDEPKELIGEIRPQVLVKGNDWAHYVSGREIVEGDGGRVVLAEMVEGRSTSSTIERVLAAYGDAS